MIDEINILTATSNIGEIDQIGGLDNDVDNIDVLKHTSMGFCSGEEDTANITDFTLFVTNNFKVKNMYASIYTIGDHVGLEALESVLAQQPDEVKLLVDSRFLNKKNEVVEEFKFLAKNTDGVEVIAGRTHAKWILFELESGEKVSFVSSSNFGYCAIIEDYQVFTSDAVFDVLRDRVEYAREVERKQFNLDF